MGRQHLSRVRHAKIRVVHLGWALICAMMIAVFGMVLGAPPNVIDVYADWQQISKQHVAKSLEQHLHQHSYFFSLPSLHAHLKQVPWVSDVFLKRMADGRLTVVLQPMHAVARLTAGRWLTQSGHVVSAPRPFSDQDTLPIFDGQQDDYPRMLVFYAQIQHALQGQPWQVKQLRYRAFSKQWQLELQGNILLRLGQDTLAKKHLNRWLRALPFLEKKHFAIANHYYDMRYPDGFAVGSLHAVKNQT